MRSSVHYEKKRKRWRVAWREDGRQRTKRFRTKTEAIAWQQFLARGSSEVDTTTVREWCLEWMRQHGPGWEERTIRDRTRNLRLYIGPGVGHLRLVEISRVDIREWRTKLLAKGKTAKVVNDAVRILSAALGAAEADDRITLNPCRGLRRLPEPRTPRVPFTLDELEALRLELARPVDRMVVSLMAYAGLRPAEVRGLTWDDVRPQTLRVHRSMGPSGKLKGTKTGAERSIPIMATVAQDLKKLKRGGPEDLVVDLGTDWDSWTEDTFRPARTRAGAPKPPYSLRHTFASLMIAEGRTIQEVAALLGHSTTDLTHRTYGHLFAEAQLAENQDAEAAAVAARKRAPRRRRERARQRDSRSSASTAEKSSS